MEDFVASCNAWDERAWKIESRGWRKCVNDTALIASYLTLNCHGTLIFRINKMLHTIACTFCMQNILFIKSWVLTEIRPHFVFCMHRCDYAGRPLLHCSWRRSDTGAKPLLLSCASNLYLWANHWPWWGPKDSCAYKCIVYLLSSILSVGIYTSLWTNYTRAQSCLLKALLILAMPEM